MTDKQAADEAARRGLWADALFGWCNVRAHQHGRFVSRGSTWEEAFGRLEARAAEAMQQAAAECGKVVQRGLFD